MILARLAVLAVTLALLAGPLRAEPSRADEAVGVEILQYGLFRADIVGRQPDATGVVHNIVDNVCHIATTRDVPMKVGVHFGVRFKVTGPRGEKVVIRKEIHYPKVMGPPSGPSVPMAVNFVQLETGTSSYSEYALEQPWELAPGTWTFRFIASGVELASFSFTVSEGASVSEDTEPTCFQLSS